MSIESVAEVFAKHFGTARGPKVQTVRHRAFVPEIRAVNEKSRTITFVASDETVDRYGDILRVRGWKLDSYKKNPVFLWAHQSGQPPIGRTVDIHTEANPPALVQKVEFADAATYPFADTIFNLYKAELSIRFRWVSGRSSLRSRSSTTTAE